MEGAVLTHRDGSACVVLGDFGARQGPHSGLVRRQLSLCVNSGKQMGEEGETDRIYQALRQNRQPWQGVSDWCALSSQNDADLDTKFWSPFNYLSVSPVAARQPR